MAPDDGVSLASGAPKGAKRRNKHAAREEAVAELCYRLAVFEEAFEKVAQAATAKKPSGYSSEDDTRPNKSPDSELRSVINVVQRGLRKASARESKKTDDLANKVCALLTKEGNLREYTPTKPRRSPWRASSQSGGSTDTSGPPGSMKTGSSGLKSSSKARLVSFDDDHTMVIMREPIAARKKKKQMSDEATKSLSSKGKASKGTEKATIDEDGRKLAN